jgi:hypothetical protein
LNPQSRPVGSASSGEARKARGGRGAVRGAGRQLAASRGLPAGGNEGMGFAADYQRADGVNFTASTSLARSGFVASSETGFAHEGRGGLLASQLHTSRGGSRGRARARGPL